MSDTVKTKKMMEALQQARYAVSDFLRSDEKVQALAVPSLQLDTLLLQDQLIKLLVSLQSEPTS